MKGKKQKRQRQRVEVNIEALDKIVDKAAHEPLNTAECEQLKKSIHVMAARLLSQQQRTTERARDLLEGQGEAAENSAVAVENASVPQGEPEKSKTPRPGHGRIGADSYTGATIVAIPYEGLTPKCSCPGCDKGKVYQMDPSPVVRVTGMPPIQATVYQLQQLRCNLCGEIFKASAPVGIGDEKYDASVAAMVASLKYGSGMPFHRIEKLQKQMGVPLPEGTQFDLVAEAEEQLQLVGKELTCQAAQAEVVTYDDTVARILDEVTRPEEQDEDRTGLKTTGIVADGGGHLIALFITGPKHAGENMTDLLLQRPLDLPPMIGMADALASNQPKVPPGVEFLLSSCLTHGRRQFVNVLESFPQECRYVIEQLGLVYLHDDEAAKQNLTKEARLSFHQQKSGPVMEALKTWMEAQLKEKKTEPNSGLGKAIKYFLKRWERLTLFLTYPGSPLDSNVVERALKKAILHRKNALFFKTEHGARVSDLFMSLIHTCELNAVNSFEYLHQLLRHVPEVQANPAAWLPWNFRLQLAPAQGCLAVEDG